MMLECDQLNIDTSIEQAVATYPHPENIPQLNIELTRDLGLARMQALLAACYPPKIN